MTRLLVSVRNAAEAQEALTGGAEIIDVKEPRAGSLGAADWQTWAEVAEAVRDQCPLSAALGDLSEHGSAARVDPLPSGFGLAKMGLADCAGFRDWPRRLEQMHEQLAPSSQAVAVAYADWKQANAPPPSEVLNWARQSACKWVLVDTFDKSSGTLLDHWSMTEIVDWVKSIGAHSMLSALAGSLTLENVERVLDARPDVIAVRGAACRGRRTDRIDRHRVNDLKCRLSQRRAPSR